MKRILSLLTVLMGFFTVMFGQGAKNIKISEVLSNNTVSLQDEFGQHLPWLELANTSFSTYNVRGMFITTNRGVLKEGLSAPERIAMMQIIPNGDPRTNVTARQHLIFFLSSNPSKGALHLSTPITPGAPLWIALYDGNGIDLIDSVSVPALDIDQSYARVDADDHVWEVKSADRVTPGRDNVTEVSENKISRLKRDDPYGFGITVLSMGIVFFCLFLLFVFFSLFGKYIVSRRKAAKSKISEYPAPPVKLPSKGTKSVRKDIEMAVAALALDEEMSTYMAVISLALQQYQDDVHDVESGIITIKPHETRWHNDFSQQQTLTHNI